jgi:hypothetical protein
LNAVKYRVDILDPIVLPFLQQWNQWWRARSQAILVVLWLCLRIGPTTGRLARSPDSRSLLRTVWPKIRTFARMNDRPSNSRPHVTSQHQDRHLRLIHLRNYMITAENTDFCWKHN